MAFDLDAFARFFVRDFMAFDLDAFPRFFIRDFILRRLANLQPFHPLVWAASPSSKGLSQAEDEAAEDEAAAESDDVIFSL